MKAHCLPYAQIPHTSRLFLDYLSGAPSVQRFYPHSAHFGEWFREVATQITYPAERREQVAAILQRQNQNWGASATTLENVQRLRSGAYAVVTGQQVGLFGGPLFAALKALSAIKLAAKASSAGVNCVPIFWLATEDHDLAEVNHVSVLGSGGTMHTLTTPTAGTPESPVGRLVFGEEIAPVVRQAADLLGNSEVEALLRESYRDGETFGTAFARLFSKLFADYGVILLDASDRELHGIAEPVYLTAIERSKELGDDLLARDKELDAAGYHKQVKVTPSSTLLFAMNNGARLPVHRRGNEDEFLVGEDRISREELLRRIHEAPYNFSPNVLLRPVVQDYLLPTLAYTGGTAEIAYFAQAGVVYEKLLGRITPIVPRLSATIVDDKAAGLLSRYKLSVPDLFHGPEELRERLASETLPEEVQTAFDDAENALETSLGQVREALARLDKTLVDSAANAVVKMHYQLKQLRARASRAELRRSEVLNRHADLLSNTLFPHKTLQEREIAGIYFIAHQGTNFLAELYNAMNTDCVDHQIVSV